jgi:hypothetical protein
MAVNAGPYASWGLYKANSLPLAFVRWWLDGPPPIPPVTGPGFPITAQSRLTTISAQRINKSVAMARLTEVKATRAKV